MIQAQPTIDPKLAEAIRAVIYREKGKAPLSVVISKLRLLGWTRLGSTELFAEKCEHAGFKIEHQMKKNKADEIARTFVVLPEEELA